VKGSHGDAVPEKEVHMYQPSFVPELDSHFKCTDNFIFQLLRHQRSYIVQLNHILLNSIIRHRYQNKVPQAGAEHRVS